jgi:tetratricopeptide (TPR) repeat protein
MPRFTIYLLTGFLASLLLYALIQGFPTSQAAKDPAAQIKEAEAAYKAGEASTTVAERNQAFNRALTLYTNLEQQFHPDLGNGKLFYNIANSYYQLSDYPQAVYYYYRAAALAPLDSKIQHNLQRALEKLNLSYSAPSSLSGESFSLSILLSLPQRLMLLFWTIILLFCLISLFIWRPMRGLKIAIWALAAVALYFLLNVGYARFLAPQEGVLVKATSLYRDAGLQYAKTSSEPLPAGMKVQIIHVHESGKWLKIMSPTGSLGFLPSESIRLL